MEFLIFDNVSYETSEGTILKDISIGFKKGEFVTITGPSGSGKSTFLKMINHLVSPSHGGIYYMDKNLFEYDAVELRKEIVMCFQMPYLFGESIYDNLSFPFQIRKMNPDQDLIVRTISLFNIGEDLLNKDIRNLSGGEKQRVALARSIIFNPNVLLLDEVTSALDEENTLLVERVIKDLNKKGTTVFWITHDLNQESRLSGRKVHINKGKLEEGSI